MASSFYNPVDAIGLNLPTYPHIIKKPMDLGKIGTRLRRGLYQNAAEFESDVRVMFSNAYTWYPETDHIWEQTQSLEALFNKQWAQKIQCISDNDAPIPNAQVQGGLPTPDDTPQSKPEVDFTDEFTHPVAIHVGKGNKIKTFTIHKNLFTKASPYFASALESQKPDPFNAIYLEDEDPSISSATAKTVYTSGLDKTKIASASFNWHAKYFLALHRYQLTDHERAHGESLHSHLSQYCGAGISDDLMSYIYANAVRSSALREIARDILVYVIRQEPARAKEFKGCFREFPEIAVDMAEKLA